MSVVIVGAGHAGVQVAASLRQLKYEGEITLIGAEPYTPYQRPPLSKEYLRHEQDLDRITLRPKAFYRNNAIRLMLEREVLAIDRNAQMVELASNERVPYDKLVLATGSKPISPPIPGRDLQCVNLFRSIDEVDAILNDLGSSNRVGIIGGGYIGLEVAASLRQLELAVSVVEMEERLLKRVATEMLGEYFKALHQQHHVDLHLSSQVVEIIGDGDGRATALSMSNGTKIDVDLVIIGVGVQPVTALASQADLHIDNGILVNERCETNDDRIYAVGDCTNHPNPLLNRRLRLESVPNAMEQARVAASNIVGKPSVYASYPWFWSDQFDVKLQMVGFSHEADSTVRRTAKEPNAFTDFHFKNGVLVGADSINSGKEFMAARLLCGKKVDADSIKNSQIDLRSIVKREPLQTSILKFD